MSLQSGIISTKVVVCFETERRKPQHLVVNRKQMRVLYLQMKTGKQEKDLLETAW